jgi:hypothetical protein
MGHIHAQILGNVNTRYRNYITSILHCNCQNKIIVDNWFESSSETTLPVRVKDPIRPLSTTLVSKLLFTDYFKTAGGLGGPLNDFSACCLTNDTCCDFCTCLCIFINFVPDLLIPILSRSFIWFLKHYFDELHTVKKPQWNWGSTLTALVPISFWFESVDEDKTKIFS